MDGIDFAIYAYHNTPYTVWNDMEDVIFKLQNSSKILFQWFLWITKWKADLDKYRFICSTNDTVNLIVENKIIDNSKCQNLFGVKFDYN